MNYKNFQRQTVHMQAINSQTADTRQQEKLLDIYNSVMFGEDQKFKLMLSVKDVGNSITKTPLKPKNRQTSLLDFYILRKMF